MYSLCLSVVSASGYLSAYEKAFSEMGQVSEAFLVQVFYLFICLFIHVFMADLQLYSHETVFLFCSYSLLSYLYFICHLFYFIFLTNISL